MFRLTGIRLGVLDPAVAAPGSVSATSPRFRDLTADELRAFQRSLDAAPDAGPRGTTTASAARPLSTLNPDHLAVFEKIAPETQARLRDLHAAGAIDTATVEGALDLVQADLRRIVARPDTSPRAAPDPDSRGRTSIQPGPVSVAGLPPLFDPRDLVANERLRHNGIDLAADPGLLHRLIDGHRKGEIERRHGTTTVPTPHRTR